MNLTIHGNNRRIFLHKSEIRQLVKAREILRGLAQLAPSDEATAKSVIWITTLLEDRLAEGQAVIIDSDGQLIKEAK